MAAVAVARALDLRLTAAVLVLVLLSIEVSNILPTLPGQPQQVLPQIPLGMMAMAGTSYRRERTERNST